MRVSPASIFSDRLRHLLHPSTPAAVCARVPSAPRTNPNQFFLHPVAALSALLLITPQLVLAVPVAGVAVAQAAQAAQAESAVAQVAAATRKVVKCFKSKDFSSGNADQNLTDICIKSDSFKAVCPMGANEPEWSGKGSSTYCDTCTCVNP